MDTVPFSGQTARKARAVLYAVEEGFLSLTRAAVSLQRPLSAIALVMLFQAFRKKF